MPYLKPGAPFDLTAARPQPKTLFHGNPPAFAETDDDVFSAWYSRHASRISSAAAPPHSERICCADCQHANANATPNTAVHRQSFRSGSNIFLRSIIFVFRQGCLI